MRNVVYWIATTFIALETLVGGVTDLVHGGTVLVAGPPVVQVVTQLGYPAYLLRILGIWKVLGGIALLIPGFPRLKEWAYAGIFFELSGAAASWLIFLHSFAAALAPMFLAATTIVSWALRPQSRRLGTILSPGLGREMI